MIAAPCGPNFDQSLDKEVGYYDFLGPGGTQALSYFAPGAGLVPSDLTTTGNQKRDEHTLAKRGFFSKLVSKVVAVVKAVAAPIVKVAAAVVVAVVKPAVVAIATIAPVLNTPVSKSISFGMPVNVGPPNNDYSPWGKAYRIYSCTSPTCGGKPDDSKMLANVINKRVLRPVFNQYGVQQQPATGVTVYCVGCGITGKVNVGGSLTFRLVDGITAATLSVNGNLVAALNLGVNGFAVWDKDLAKLRLLTVGLPGFEIPGIVTIGPEITLDVKLHVSTTAEGQLYAGGTMSLPNFAASVDFINHSKSKATGWTPQFQYTLSAYGFLQAEASLGFPLGITFGVDILKGKYKLEAGVVDTPALVATASYSGSFSVTDGTCAIAQGKGDGLTNEDSDCEGIKWSVGLNNKVELEFTEAYTYELGNWDGPKLGSGCITIPTANICPPRPSSSSSSSSSKTSSSSSRTSSSSSKTSSLSPTATACSFPGVCWYNSPVIKTLGGGNVADCEIFCLNNPTDCGMAIYDNTDGDCYLYANPYNDDLATHCDAGATSFPYLVISPPGCPLSSLPSPILSARVSASSSPSSTLVASITPSATSPTLSFSSTTSPSLSSRVPFVSPLASGVTCSYPQVCGFSGSISGIIDRTLQPSPEDCINYCSSLDNCHWASFDIMHNYCTTFPMAYESSFTFPCTKPEYFYGAILVTSGTNCTTVSISASPTSSSLSPSATSVSTGSCSFPTLCGYDYIYLPYSVQTGGSITDCEIIVLNHSQYKAGLYNHKNGDCLLLQVDYDDSLALHCRPQDTVLYDLVQAPGCPLSQMPPAVLFAPPNSTSSVVSTGYSSSMVTTSSSSFISNSGSQSFTAQSETFSSSTSLLPSPTSGSSTSFSSSNVLSSSSYSKTSSSSSLSCIPISESSSYSSGTASISYCSASSSSSSSVVDFLGSSSSQTTSDPSSSASPPPSHKIKRKRDVAAAEVIIHKRQSDNSTSGSDNSDTLPASGGGFDAAAAAAEDAWVVTTTTDTDYAGLPSFEEVMAATYNSTGGVTIGSGTGNDTTVNNGTNTSSSDGGLLRLYDTSYSVEMAALSSGALILEGFGAADPSFAAVGAEVGADLNGRLLVFSPYTMGKEGVSRIHLVSPATVPRESRLLILVLVPTSSGNIYVPVDTAGNAYYLAWCTIDYGSSQVNKVFLVSNYGAALTKLATDQNLVYTVLGGKVVGSCNPLALTSDATPDVSG
jgi:hypothetical protein